MKMMKMIPYADPAFIPPGNVYFEPARRCGPKPSWRTLWGFWDLLGGSWPRGGDRPRLTPGGLLAAFHIPQPTWTTNTQRAWTTDSTQWLASVLRLLSQDSKNDSGGPI